MSSDKIKSNIGRSWFDALTTNGPFALSLSKGNGPGSYVEHSERFRHA